MTKTFAELNFPGRLLAVEGLDGSGKSTQIYLLKRWLELQGLKVYFSEWNSSELVKNATSKGKKRALLTPTTFCLIHATDGPAPLVASPGSMAHEFFLPKACYRIRLANRLRRRPSSSTSIHCKGFEDDEGRIRRNPKHASSDAGFR